MTGTGSGRTALVTGGSRGIGRAVAERLAEDGLSVAVNYSSSETSAIEVVEGLRSRGLRAQAFGCDVSDESQVAAMFEEVTEELGPVAVLVNNAGITRDNLLMRMSSEEFDDVIAVNLRSTFLCTKAALRGMMRAKWGRIVSIASVAGITGNAGQANYAASKAGMIGFTKSIAKEYGSRGITANVVAPGFITTDMTDALGGEVRETAMASITVGRFGAPADVAAAVAFLASEEAAYITGQVLPVDGGIAL